MFTFHFIVRKLALLNGLLACLLLTGIMLPESFVFFQKQTPRNPMTSAVIKFIGDLERQLSVATDTAKAKTIRRETRRELLTYFEDSLGCHLILPDPKKPSGLKQYSVKDGLTFLTNLHDADYKLIWTVKPSTLTFTPVSDSETEGQIGIRQEIQDDHNNLLLAEQVIHFRIVNAGDEYDPGRHRITVRNIELIQRTGLE